MRVVAIAGASIGDESSFHDVFAAALGFPSLYGRNMDAWIDCMGYVDDPSAGMCSVTVELGDMLVLNVSGAAEFKQRCPGLWASFLECAAFVNWRRVEKGGSAILAIAAYPGGQHTLSLG